MSRNVWKSKVSGWVGRVAVVAVLGAVSAAPAMAQSKMSGGKMMGGHMKMMSASDQKVMMGMSAAEKKVAMMPMNAKMTAAQKQTMKGMTAGEKKVAMKMMKMHGGLHGGKMSAKSVAMTCPHCNVAMKNGKCPMCGMTMSQMKSDKMKKM